MPHRRLLPLLLAACVGGEEVGESVHDLKVCADGETVEGIDVSKWQGEIDWDAVAASGVKFAFIRVSDGLNYPDGYFAINWRRAKEVGILRGAYQFFRPGQDAAAQAQLLLDTMGTLEPGDLPPVIDVEATDGLGPATVAAQVSAWMHAVEPVVQRKPIIYSGKYFWNDQVGGLTEFSTYPLWLAAWVSGCPDTPTAWTRWTFWQYSSTGSIPGIGGAVDKNVFNGSQAQLLELAHANPVSCGDGVCNGGETAATCSVDCLGCRQVPPEGRIIDDEDVCFVPGGGSAYLIHEDAGWENGLIWTHTTASATAYNYGLWRLDVEKAGRYRIEVYTPAPWSQSKQAVYQVRHDGTVDLVTVDQTAQDGWAVVGDFELAAGADQWVRVDDNTGEEQATNTQLVFDAVRVTPADDDLTGGCSMGRRRRSSPAGILLLVGVAAVTWVRRRSRSS